MRFNSGVTPISGASDFSTDVGNLKRVGDLRIKLRDHATQKVVYWFRKPVTIMPDGSSTIDFSQWPLYGGDLTDEAFVMDFYIEDLKKTEGSDTLDIKAQAIDGIDRKHRLVSLIWPESWSGNQLDLDALFACAKRKVVIDDLAVTIMPTDVTANPYVDGDGKRIGFREAYITHPFVSWGDALDAYDNYLDPSWSRTADLAVASIRAFPGVKYSAPHMACAYTHPMASHNFLEVEVPSGYAPQEITPDAPLPTTGFEQEITVKWLKTRIGGIDSSGVTGGVSSPAAGPNSYFTWSVIVRGDTQAVYDEMSDALNKWFPYTNDTLGFAQFGDLYGKDTQTLLANPVGPWFSPVTQRLTWGKRHSLNYRSYPQIAGATAVEVGSIGPFVVDAYLDIDFLHPHAAEPYVLSRFLDADAYYSMPYVYSASNDRYTNGGRGVGTYYPDPTSPYFQHRFCFRIDWQEEEIHVWASAPTGYHFDVLQGKNIWDYGAVDEFTVTFAQVRAWYQAYGANPPWTSSVLPVEAPP